MKKNILIMLLISSLISLSGFGQSFTFKSSGTTFALGEHTEHEGNITIKPGVNGGTKTTIVKDEIYTINTNQEYTVKGNFTELYVSDNELTNLDVSKLKSLTTLTCENNLLEVLDVSKLENLTYLGCNLNKLASLDLSKLKKLTYLICDSNKLTNLNLSGLKDLEYIECQNNLFNHCAIDELFKTLPTKTSDESSLRSIYIASYDEPSDLVEGCHIKTANDKGWQVLEYFSPEHNVLTEIEPFLCMDDDDDVETQSFTFKSSGTTLNIGINTKHSGSIKIKPGIGDAAETTIVKNVRYDIDAKKEYTVTGSFTELDVFSNKITSLDVSKLKSLTLLTCENNLLGVLDVSKLENLKHLVCDLNQLTSLDLSELKDLKHIECQNNKFDHCAIDELFKTLPTKTSDESSPRSIYIASSDEPSDLVEGCHIKTANKKGWQVLEYSSPEHNVLTEIEPFLCPSSIPENLASELVIKVFPNPVRDALQIESEEVIKQVSIFDISGKLLIKELVNDVNFSLLTTDLHSGIYVLRILTDKGISNIKVIKE